MRLFRKYNTNTQQGQKSTAKQREKAVKSILKLLFNAIFWKTVRELIFIWYIKKFRAFYTHIDYLPLFNFGEIMKGNFHYLYHKPKNRRAPKVYFANIFKKMQYQFYSIDNTSRRDRADLADYKSKYVRTGNKRWLNEYNTLSKKIDKKVSVPFNTDRFTDYIEQTFNLAPGSIDTKKISTAKAFANYQEAVKRNKKK